MGVTISSIHVYSKDEISLPDLKFVSFSQNWYTLIAEQDTLNSTLAKKISKLLQMPVLWFSTLDSEGIAFCFCLGGKFVSQYSDFFQQSKGIFSIPSLIGYEKGHKRRISHILSCSDFDQKISLLEEFFGVCLLLFPELLTTSPAEMNCVRGEAKYLEFNEEEKKLRGKNAPVKATLISKAHGKIFYQRFKQNIGYHRHRYFYFGYDTEASAYSDGNLRPIHFLNGEFIPAAEEDMSVQLVSDSSEDESFRINYDYPKVIVDCTEKAPKRYANKSLVMPNGFFPLGFDNRERIFLYNIHGGIVVMDPDNKIISRFSVKGIPFLLDGEYILTSDQGSFFAYLYEPNSYICIYRITDKSQS